MRPHTLVLLILLAIPLQADILTLRDGRRYHGQVIWEGKREIVFRIVVGPGSSVVRRFPLARVKQIERTARPPASHPTASGDKNQPPSTDFEQMLREAYELIDDGDPAAGLRALRRIVTRAPAGALSAIERRVPQDRGVSLAQLMATLRLRVALRERGGRLLNVRYVTDYEAGALGRLLERIHNTRLKRVYDGRTLAQWSRAPDDYAALAPDARQLEYDARLAAAAIGVRLRYDPRLKTDRDERRRLLDLRARLGQLAARIATLPGFTSLGVDEAALPDAMRDFVRELAEASATSQPAASSPAGRAIAPEP